MTPSHTRDLLQPRRKVFIHAAALLVAVGEAAAWPTLTGLVVMLVIGGAAVAPLLTSSTQLVHTAVQPAVLTQALVWVNTASTAGPAGAAAVTGALVQHAGQRAATTALLVVLTAVAATGAVLTAGADSLTGTAR